VRREAYSKACGDGLRPDLETFDQSLRFDAPVWELWPYLAAGASVYLADEITRSSPELLRDWLVAQGITISFVPTPMADRMPFLEWPPVTALRMTPSARPITRNWWRKNRREPSWLDWGGG
jgi:non-ribosomal peptide synthetase component F